MSSTGVRRSVEELVRVLDDQVAAHNAYRKLLTSESTAITNFKSEAVAEIVQHRDKVIREIERLRNAQIRLVKELSAGAYERLSEAVKHCCSGEEAALLEPRIDQLRQAINQSSSDNQSLGQLTQFALNIVHGSLSILWSANQKSTSSYSASGKIQHQYQPVGARNSGILRQV